jgi:hypothetical protein
MALLSRGYAPQGMATLFEFVRLQSNLKATLTYFRRGEQPFSITTKDATEERRRIQAPWTLWVLLALTGLAVVWFACTLAGLTPVVYHLRWTVYGALFWVLVNLGFLAGALSRIRSDRFASERRAAVRLQTGGPASIEGHQGHLLDISVGGAMIRCEQPPNHAKAHLEIGLECAGHEIALLGEERGRQALPDGSAIIRLRGYELVPGESTGRPAAVACSISSPS